MKKILQAIDAGGWGGAEKVVVMISNELAGMGHDVEVWVRRGSPISRTFVFRGQSQGRALYQRLRAHYAHYFCKGA
ncbi:hypothetical protein [Acetomicrobium sp.]|uniref:hypothetical protein n=1 Tax=Acetomicrobium sp. TaxID=1872099 RepID=UPI002FC74131